MREEATEEAEEEGAGSQRAKTKITITQRCWERKSSILCTHRVLHLLCKKVRSPAEAVDHRQRPVSLSAAPATQKQHPVHRVLHLPRKKVRGPAETVAHRQRPGSLSAAPATQKSSIRCTKCCTCHAKRCAVPRRPLTTGSAQAL